MFSLLVASVLAFHATSAAAGASLVPPPETLSSTSSAPGSSSTTATNGSLSATPTSSANFPSLSGFSDCVTNCLQLSVANANCTSVIDVNCYCKTPRFAQSLVNCTQVSCNQEVGTAESLAQQFCVMANASTSLSFPPTTSISSSSSLISTSSLASSTPTTPSQTSSSVTSTTAIAGNTVATSNAAASGLLVGSTSMVSSQSLGLCLAFLGFLVGAVLVE